MPHAYIYMNFFPSSCISPFCLSRFLFFVFLVGLIFVLPSFSLFSLVFVSLFILLLQLSVFSLFSFSFSSVFFPQDVRCSVRVPLHAKRF